MEKDDRYYVANLDLGQEKSRARTKATDGSAVSPHVEQNLLLLDETCFTPFRREAHEVQSWGRAGAGAWLLMRRPGHRAKNRQYM